VGSIVARTSRIATPCAWGTRHAALFTFPQSAMHLALYQKFGFHARFLTAIMAAPARSPGNAGPWSRYSQLPETEPAAAVKSCRELTEESMRVWI
jgi:hypothetical protein